MSRIGPVSGAIILLSVSPAGAQQAGWPACRDARSPGDRIAACSRALPAISSPALLERAFLRLGNAYLEADMAGEAAAAFSRLLALNPRVAGYWDNRHAAYRKLGNNQAALADVTEAIRLQPTMTFGYRSRGLLMDAMGQPEAALRDFSTAIRLDGADGGLRAERGKVLERAGRIEDAVRDYSDAMAVDSKAFWALKERARAYGKLGRRQEALADINAFLLLQPGDAEAGQILAALQQPPAEPKPSARPQPGSAPKDKGGVSTGSGFFVSAKGQVVTNAHVVRGCTSVQVASQDEVRRADVVARDESNDLALLRTGYQPARVAAVRPGPRLGEPVAVFGFPLTGLLSSHGNFTLGNISSLAGMGDDSKFLQITAPVQPGNSGGPVLDQSGNLIGVVVSKLNVMKLAAVTDDVAQNVNFAIKANVLSGFLESAGVQAPAPSSGPVLEPAQLAEAAQQMAVMIACSP